VDPTTTTHDAVQKAAQLLPVLRENTAWEEENSRLHEDTVSALIASGLPRMKVPARYGGLETPMRDQVDVLAELARGSGAASWTVGVWTISSWTVGLFPDAVQEKVFASGDTLVSGILSPSAMATPVDGGISVSGTWRFNTGAWHSSWNANAVLLHTPEGPRPVLALLAMSDLDITDDWDTSGLRGSGSVTTSADAVFVPDGWYIPLGALMSGQGGLGSNADRPTWHSPIMPTACATVAATAAGLAQAAGDAFFDRLPGRSITYTDYADQREAPLTHRQVAQAVVRTDEALFHVHRIADLVDAKNGSAEPWTPEERAKARLLTGAATQRAKEAVEVLASASGASSIHRTVPIQRILRDVQALSVHAAMNTDTALELYGRLLCGLPLNSTYV